MWLAFSIGFLGSFHCIGMCGPIAMALPLNRKSFLKKYAGILIYNFGRITTYALMGTIFGLLGQGIRIAGFQQILSITIGILLVISAFMPKILDGITFKGKIGILLSRMQYELRLLFKKSSYESLFSIGFLNGFLPCGLVYMAIGSSLAQNSLINSILFMVFFGLGTMPMMVFASELGAVISINFRNKIKRLIPVFIGVTGLFFIVRGMNLNIPYISPKINVERPMVQQCD
jgi:hypothetical protein